MEHYSLEKWIDFARNVMADREKEAMQTHLQTGCRRCLKVLNLWQRARNVAKHLGDLDPPESAVRSVKGTFAFRGPSKARRGAGSLATLLFDSLQAPLMAGVRSNESAGRQMLFGASDFRIDIRMEPKADSDKVTLVGQVLCTTEPSDGVGGAPVALIKGSKVVAETITNRFGEFHLECDLQGRFDLWIKLPSEELRLPLIEPVPARRPSVPLSHDSKEVSKIVRRSKKRTRRRV